ncbi:MAG: diguanylate cyclase [Thermoanaerobaculia bacterium]
MRAERIFRATLGWALVLAVASLLFLQGREAVRGAGRRLGFTPDEGKQGILVRQVTPGQPAERDGLRAGDEILKVGGRRVANLSEYEEEAMGFQRGRPVKLSIARRGRSMEVAVVPGASPRWLPVALSALSALGFLLVALLALALSPGDRRVQLLFAFSAAVALEMGLPTNAVGRPMLGAVSLSAFYLLTGVQIAVEMHLASLIPERGDWLRRRPWVVPLYYGLGLGWGLGSFATYWTEEVLGRRAFPWSAGAVDRWQEVGVMPLWALAVTAILAVQAQRHPEPRGRQQAGLVLAAVIPWMLYVVSTTVLELRGFPLPVWTGTVETLILLGYPAAFFAAIFRFHLFDIERVAKRGLIYTTLTGALVLLFYAALGAGGAVFSHLVEGSESTWSISGATLLLGLVFSPMRRALQRLIDRRFFPDRYATRGQLIALAGELPALGKPARMGGHLVERLASIFAARSATLLVAHPETGVLSVLATTRENLARDLLIAPEDPRVEPLRRARKPLPSEWEPEGLAVPMLSRERLAGVLVMGRKEGSGGYPAEELDLLNLLAHHVATVFENARLFESATYEGLTGLLRREAILEQLDRELERALRYGRPLTIAMADLDHFKQVNDRYGHLAGDALLRRVAQLISGALRGTDWIGRYGGEEFLIVLPETDLAGGAAVAEKIRTLVQGTRLPAEDGGPPGVTVSIGLATLSDLADPGKPAGRDLIAVADRSLYDAKNAGRNQVFPRVA